ncbi:MAG TPA: hypothetical protein VIP53_03045 [Nitrososphaera sp.]
MNKQISDHVSKNTTGVLHKTPSVEGLSIFYRETKRLVQSPAQNRGQVAAQEQIKILREAVANETEEQALPLNRGQVAAMEQVRILREAVAGAMQEQAPPPQNRGQVAAQEQFRIIREALGISNT